MIAGKMEKSKHSVFILYFETGSHSVTQANLELSILLPQPPKCWDYRCVAPHPAKDVS
jgi:hypothetical protein